MFTFIGYDLLVHYIYIISVLRQRRRSFLLDWGGGGGNLKDAKKKKKLARFARKFAIANFSRMARWLNLMVLWCKTVLLNYSCIA